MFEWLIFGSRIFDWRMIEEYLGIFDFFSRKTARFCVPSETFPVHGEMGAMKSNANESKSG